MRKHIIILAILSITVLLWENPVWASHRPPNLHRIGVGVHYWESLEDIIIDDVDDGGLAFLLSYQYQMLKFFTIEADVELLGEGYAGADSSVLAPQMYVLIGRGLYGGVGVGINFSDGDFAGEPFFALRAGVDLEILPSIFLDLNANYRSEEWDFDRIDDELELNTITVGATVRFEFN